MTPDHGVNPCQGPALGIEAGARRPLLEDAEQFLPLLVRQPRRAPRFGTALQCRKPLVFGSQSPSPEADGHTADTEAPSDLGLRERAGAEPATRFEPALFELFGSEFVRLPHACQRNDQSEFVKRLT
jgi:hypothetical protein